MSGELDRAREVIARRAAQELRRGDVVNLGVGIPMDVLHYIDPTLGFMLHSENGIVGMGPYPSPEDEDPDLTNAGARPVTLLPGASVFDVLMSATIMRGGHLDNVFMGAYQVDRSGNLANWLLSRTAIKGGIGGAMDLAVGATKLTALMTHTTKAGEPRLLEACSMPLTAMRVVTRVITELAVIDVRPEGLVLRELLDGADLDQVRSRTGTELVDGRIGTGP